MTWTIFATATDAERFAWAGILIGVALAHCGAIIILAARYVPNPLKRVPATGRR